MKQLHLYWGENYSSKNKMICRKINKALKFSLDAIHLYPGKQYDKTIQKLAQYHSMEPSQFLLGNGIEGLINIISRTYVNKSARVAILSPSFSVYEASVINYGGKLLFVSTKINKMLNVEAVYNKVQHTNLFYVAFPNNPTGHYIFTMCQIDYLLSKYKGLLVVDECYFGIGNVTALSLLKKHNNLIILRSFSKCQGLAGMRFGYALSSPLIINKLKKYSHDIEADSINIFTHLIVTEIVDDIEILTKQYINFKTNFINLLIKKVNNIEILTSLTTFLLVKINKKNCSVYNQLKKEKIYIKNTSCYKYFPQNIIMFGVPKKEDWFYFIRHLKRILE